jgi:opacity protein-like surface antigen
MCTRILLVSILAAVIPLDAQVVPSATEGSSPISAGLGYSNYATDWSGRLQGPTFWITWDLPSNPRFLRGFGLEVEGRDLQFGRPSTQANLRLDTLDGGVIYKWRHYPTIRPYAKYLVGLGSIDFDISRPTYTHDTRTVYAPGGGIEYRIWHNVWARGDYEYEFWTDFFHHNSLNPHGATVGISYNSRHSGHH